MSCHIRVTQPSLAPLPRVLVLRPGQLSGCPCSGHESPIPALPLVQGSAFCPACHWLQLWHFRACPISPGPVAMCKEQVLPSLERNLKAWQEPPGSCCPVGSHPGMRVELHGLGGIVPSLVLQDSETEGSKTRVLGDMGSGQGLTSCLLPSGVSSCTVAS